MERVDRLGEATRPPDSIRAASGASWHRLPRKSPAPARGVTRRAETGPGLEPADGSGAAAPVLARGGGAPRADE